MDAVRIAHHFKCSKEAYDWNGITKIQEVRFHLRRVFLHHLKKKARHFYFVTSEAIGKPLIMVVNGMATVLFYGLKTQQRLFRPLN